MPDFDDILRQLDDMDAPYPAAAIQTLHDHRVDAAPALRRLLRDALASPMAYHERIVQMHAAALLADWRDDQAHAVLAQLCRLDADGSEAVWCDFTSDGLPECLVATFAGDPEPLLAAITDEAAYEWGRVAALRALGRLACEGRCNVAAVTARLLHVAGVRAEALQSARQGGDTILAVLASELTPLLPRDRVEAELLPWLASGLATSGLVSGAALQARAGDRDRALQSGNGRYANVRAERLVDHLHRVAMPAAVTPEFAPPVRPSPPPMQGFPSPAPLRRDQPKVGRNDPCPCGSGRKSKKCCAA